MQQCMLCFWHGVISGAMQGAAAWPSPRRGAHCSSSAMSKAKAWLCICWFSASCNQVGCFVFHCGLRRVSLKKLSRVPRGNKTGNVKDRCLTAVKLLNWHVGKVGSLTSAKKINR